MLDALAFGCKAFRTVETIHGAIEGQMHPVQIGKHQVGVMEIGQVVFECHGLFQRKVKARFDSV